MEVTKYRLLKSSWGISIDMTSSIEDKNNLPTNDLIKISDNIDLLVESKFDNDIVRKLLRLGILRVLENIEPKMPYENSVIVINDIQFPITDFQVEGIYGAMIQYLSNHFSFGSPEIRTSFDKTTNKYIFEDLK